MRRLLFIFLLSLAGAFCHTARAQFTDLGSNNGIGGAFQQQSTGDSASVPVTRQFSFRTYFRGLAHKDTIPASHMFLGSVVLPGTAQIYNRDYWKLPVLYGGIGGMIYGSWHFNRDYRLTGNPRSATARNLFIAGAALVYWSSLLDGVVCYRTDKDPDPAKAALYSALLPGLGQAYNGDYWKIPLFYSWLTVSGYLWNYNGQLYVRYRDLYNQATTEGGGYTGTDTPENLKHYRDTFRRYRDYSILATVLGYVLQIIDANVFAMMHDFDVSDDISLRMGPSVIEPLTIPNGFHYAASPLQPGTSLGLQFQLNF